MSKSQRLSPTPPSHPITRRAVLRLGAGAAGALALAGGGAVYFMRRMNRVAKFRRGALVELRGGASNPLFERYPALAGSVPWRPLGTFPTPVEELPPPEGAPGVRLFTKRDDLCSSLYGGNKVRKLEHLLAEAQLAGKTALVTLGGIGSNHALATALHGRALGFRVKLSLFDQPVTPFVRQNLSGFLHAGAQLRYRGGKAGALLGARDAHVEELRAGGDPYFIMVGGTSRLGNVGYVTAALELAEQVNAGQMPEPDRIFVPLGTCGTAAGLITGLKLAGLRSRVVAVRVAEPFPANSFVLRYLAQDVADYLRAGDPRVPKLRIRESDFDVLTDYLGEGYGVSTPVAEAAIRRAASHLRLETTYTGKALAACLDYCRTEGQGQTVLFWNTYSSAPVSESETLEDLPAQLQRVFQS